jgi:type II restriction/modification system DNA methylase subunit YeeA
MNKSAIQKFAIWARKELIAQVSQRAYQYGITEEGYGEADAVTVGGHALTSEEAKQRRELVAQIRQKGYTQVMEEVAYTWFNRFIALRFMEVNNYLPSHIRVFSDSTGAFKPEILSDALHLDLPWLDKDRVATYIENNQTEDLYRYLLLTQCNALNEALPRMFEKMGGYTELLFPNNILKADSVLGRMVTDIPEEDWTDQVQIIGWLYQYYNSELKDDTFALLKKNVKITKERIPSATQLFTPDWIVRYMVENSLGRLWIEGHPDDELKSGWKYYLDEAEQEPEVQAQIDKIHAEYATLKPQDIKVIDPCMGSGHILVYAFDVLIQIYKKYGVSERDAAQSILQNNLYGLDIDDRAAQLSYFAVMMKARQYDRRIFSRGIQPHIYAIAESNDIDAYTRDYFANNDPKLKAALDSIMSDLRDAKEYGSILTVAPVDFTALYARMDEIQNDISLHREAALATILPLIRVAEVMAQQYDVVVTNPPYMGGGNMDARLSEFVKKHYPDSKSDLFAVFIERCGQMTGKNRYQAMITQHAWMFLSSFEKLRTKLLLKDSVNMAHLGPRAFEEIGGEVVQTTSFVLRNSRIADYKGTYCRLIEPTTQQGKEDMFLSSQNRYTAQQSNFDKIPGSPVAYWLSEKAVSAYGYGKISDVAVTKQGFKTGNNDLFLRLWFEVPKSKISIFEGKKWFPCNKGGDFRRWYGNQEYVVEWENDGFRLVNYRDKTGKQLSRPQNIQYNFKEGITWTYISSALISLRYSPSYMMFESAGPLCLVNNSSYLEYMLGYLNSCVAQYYLLALEPTIRYSEGTLLKLPYIQEFSEITSKYVQSCINAAKMDWDSYETSWDFQRHPLLRSVSRLADAYAAWKAECEERFQQLKKNEEELNRIFIEIYGLQDELTPEVADKDVTVHRVFDTKDSVPESMQGSNYVRTKRDEVVSLISYAVGCMFGRYSLDVEGLAYAGGDWDASKYSTIIPDRDNIIPICDDDYFDDDMTGRFVKWVETVYGSDTLEENLKFIADALGGKGTPREVIRSYFLNDFYADHCKTYQKRPIYWLFDSGKKNGFKALIYMHRYQSDLLARMRTDYVHEQQERYRTQLAHLADALEHASGSERVKLTKQQKKLQDQSLEIQKYEEKIHHLADQNISIDLDDGVKHNYALFADVLAKIK